MKIFFIFFTYLLCVTAAAETYRLDSALNVRDSNTDFITTDDVIGHVSAGTEFEIISSKTLRSGANAIEIKVTKLAKGSQLNKSNTGPLYIYQNKKTEFKSQYPSTKTEADAPCADGSCHKSDSKKQMEVQPAVKISQTIVQKLEEQASTPNPDLNDMSLVDKIKNYSSSAQVQKMITWASRNITRLSGSGKCYHQTKAILSRGQLLKLPHNDLYARNAVNTLADRGFVNLLAAPYNLKLTPETAPAGAVLVYKSKVKCDRHTGRTMNTGCGHTEVKLGDGSKTNGFKYASDYKNKNSILEGATGNMYELDGVMVKLNL